MGEASQRPLADDLRRALRHHAGLDFTTLAPTDGGESGNVFRASGRSGAVSIVKVLPGTGPETAGSLRVLGETVSALRERGYPAPRLLATGEVPGYSFWVQELLHGAPLDRAGGAPDLAALARLLPELIRLNDAQAGLDPGSGRHRWPELIRRTLTTGADGYCVHETLAASPGTRHLLDAVRRTGDRHGADVPAGGDFVHYDFTPANILSDGSSITGVIDINAPVIAGDRAFDLAVPLFYCYDHDNLRAALWRRLLDLAAPGVACAYLAHIVLRQADWSLRFHPGEPTTRRHLRLAEMAVADIGEIAGYHTR
jgi:Ser/Thr protein kinase RdoA (MazF antagonist)